MALCHALEESLAFVLSDVQFSAAAAIQQVENGLVVNLDIRELDFKIYLSHGFVAKHGLVENACLRPGLRQLL